MIDLTNPLLYICFQLLSVITSVTMNILRVKSLSCPSLMNTFILQNWRGFVFLKASNELFSQPSPQFP